MIFITKRLIDTLLIDTYICVCVCVGALELTKKKRGFIIKYILSYSLLEKPYLMRFLK